MPSEDKLAVAETVYRCARAVDEREWDAHRSIFTERVTVDFSSSGASRAPVELPTDDWIAQIRSEVHRLARNAAFDGEPPSSKCTAIARP